MKAPKFSLTFIIFIDFDEIIQKSDCFTRQETEKYDLVKNSNYPLMTGVSWMTNSRKSALKIISAVSGSPRRPLWKKAKEIFRFAFMASSKPIYLHPLDVPSPPSHQLHPVVHQVPFHLQVLLDRGNDCDVHGSQMLGGLQFEHLKDVQYDLNCAILFEKIICFQPFNAKLCFVSPESFLDSSSFSCADSVSVLSRICNFKHESLKSFLQLTFRGNSLLSHQFLTPLDYNLCCKQANK